MDIALLSDWRLVVIMVAAAIVSSLLSLNVAARPAAIKTGQVATALTVAQLLFLLTRFANLFYTPLMAKFVDEAEKSHGMEKLYGQFQWVIAGTVFGGVVSWMLLATAVNWLCCGVKCFHHRETMTAALARLLRPHAWGVVARAVRPPSNLGVRLFRLEGVSPGFLLVNVVATGIWTVGLLAALYVSGMNPKFAITAGLLSGLVTGVAAIIFSVWVDPKAALITDLVERGVLPEKQVRVTAVHLVVGNLVGSLLGFFLLTPAIKVIEFAANRMAETGDGTYQSLLPLLLLNLCFTLLASTTYSSRVSAVVTRQVATAVAVYNLFFLVTRLASQFYAPALGAMRDFTVGSKTATLQQLAHSFEWIISGAAWGALLGWLLMPSFIEIYNWIITKTQERGSVPSVVWYALWPPHWGELTRCLRRPSTLGITVGDVKRLPRAFLFGNAVVVAIHTCGVPAAIYCGAILPEMARTVSLMSSVVNGLATVTLSVLVDPTISKLTDEAVKGKRPDVDVKTACFCLMASMFVGTILAQLFFYPACRLVAWAGWALDRVF